MAIGTSADFSNSLAIQESIDARLSRQVHPRSMDDDRVHVSRDLFSEPVAVCDLVRPNDISTAQQAPNSDKAPVRTSLRASRFPGVRVTEYFVSNSPVDRGFGNNTDKFLPLVLGDPNGADDNEPK